MPGFTVVFDGIGSSTIGAIVGAVVSATISILVSYKTPAGRESRLSIVAETFRIACRDLSGIGGRDSHAIMLAPYRLA